MKTAPLLTAASLAVLSWIVNTPVMAQTEPVKSREQQAALSLHRTRSLLIGQRTQLVNLMRSLLAELGIAIPVGLERALQLARQIVGEEIELDLPAEAAHVIAMLSQQTLQLHAQLRKLDLRLAALQRSDDTARRLATIPGRPELCIWHSRNWRQRSGRSAAKFWRR